MTWTIVFILAFYKCNGLWHRAIERIELFIASLENILVHCSAMLYLIFNIVLTFIIWISDNICYIFNINYFCSASISSSIVAVWFLLDLSYREQLLLLVCLFGVYRPTRDYFTHIKTSPLPRAADFDLWSIGTHGHWAVRVP